MRRNCLIGRLYLILFPVLILILAAAGPAAPGQFQKECALAGFDSPAQFISFTARLKEAVKNRDQAAVAAMVEYPLRVKLGGLVRTIPDQAGFLENYDAIMTRPVQDAAVYQENFIINRQGAMLTDRAGAGRLWLLHSKIIRIVNN